MSDEPQTSDRKGNGPDPQFVVVDRRPAFRDDAAPSTEVRYPTVVEELKARTEEAERRAREISAAYRNIEADRDAFRERLARDLERRVDLARAEMMREVIGVLDDFDRALAAARDTADPAGVIAGVTLIRDRLVQVLASEGVEVIETAGRPYDPSLAEAVAVEETDDPARDNLVLEEIEKGYTLRGNLLRAARVRVGRLARPAAAPLDGEPGGPSPAEATPQE